MTYPTGDDFLDRAEHARRERAARDAADRAEFDRTGICPRRILPTDEVRVSCAVCLHAEALHPGFTNPDPDLTGCVVCHLKRLAAGSAPGTHQLDPRAGLPPGA